MTAHLPTAQLSWLDELADGPRPRVLVVEDDEAIARSLRRALLAAGFTVEVCTDPLPELARLGADARAWDAVLIDLELPGIDGLALEAQLRNAGSIAPTIILSADASAATAVQCMQAGAFDYIVKPTPMDVLVERIRVATRITSMRRAVMPIERAAVTPTLIGGSSSTARLRTTIHRLGRQSVPVLLQGESGTGKELVARAIHDASARARMPFVAINLGSLPEALIDSELFGHRRGAFTGATSDHLGVAVGANGGTLLLDEIGDMPMAVQGRLLRFLQEGEIRPVGGQGVHTVDVRVIAATHVDLHGAVAAGRFREDLYYRLNVVAIEVAPLRARLDDVPMLVAHFLAKHRGDRPQTFTIRALEALTTYDWPGNVRQLENVVRNALALSMGPEIDIAALPPELLRQPAANMIARADQAMLARGSSVMRVPPPDLGAGPLPDFRPLADARREVTASFERAYLLLALERAAGSISEAARLAGVDRANFRRLLRRHDVCGRRAPQDE